MSDTFVVFGSITVVVALAIFIPLYFRQRNRQTIYETIGLITAKDQAVSPELIEALVRDRIPPKADLRRGVVFLAIAAAMCVFAFMVDDDGAVWPLIGIASFPGMIGLAFVGLHFFASGGTER